jgi:2-keto-4-pentenoate hydratase
VEVGGDIQAPREPVAANLCQRAVVFGPPKPRLSAVDGRLVINGHVRAGAFLEGGYVELVEQLSSVLFDTGESLLPGDRVIAGPIVRAPVRPGDRVVADLGPLGHAEIIIA